MAGAELEDPLHEVVWLWHFRGIYVDFTVRVFGEFIFPSFEAWAIIGRICTQTAFPHHPFINELAKRFVSQYTAVALKVASNA